MNTYWQKSALTVGLGWVLSTCAWSQRTLTADEAVEAALKNSHALKASSLVIKQNEQLIRCTRAVPNPELTFDSPTGVFYTLGVQQSFRLPTVYNQQAQLQQAYVGLAQKDQKITENELKFRVKWTYLNTQFGQSYLRQLQSQDSAYAQIAIAAKRNFEVGTIDKLALVFAETQAAELRNQVSMATQEVILQKNQLGILMGNVLAPEVALVPLDKMPLPMDTLGDVDSAPLVEMAKQMEVVSQKVVGVEKSSRLPSFMVGYYNQGTPETRMGLRLRAGVSIPIWWGQYKSRMEAAQTAQEAAYERTESQKQLVSLDLQMAQNEATKFRMSLAYYQTMALPQANKIIETARRFFENGQTDYINFLRTTNEAYTIKLRYIETQRSYFQSILTIQHLTGNL